MNLSCKVYQPPSISSSIAQTRLSMGALTPTTKPSLASRHRVSLLSPVVTENHAVFTQTSTTIEKGGDRGGDEGKGGPSPSEWRGLKNHARLFADILMFVIHIGSETHSSHKIIGDASCTTNCLMFLTKVICNSFSIV